MEERRRTWKALQKEAVVAAFREFMGSERIQNPAAVETELQQMRKEQLALTEERRALLWSLSDLLPLPPSKAKVNEWYESLVALNKRIDTHNVQFMMRIRIQYEKICQECLSKVQEAKQKLLKMKVCTEEEAERVVNPDFFQWVGRLQSCFEAEVEKMDSDLERLAKHTEVNCRHLSQFFQEALILRDTHRQRLLRLEEELHARMNEGRLKHESLNKVEGREGGRERKTEGMPMLFCTSLSISTVKYLPHSGTFCTGFYELVSCFNIVCFMSILSIVLLIIEVLLV
uniref:DUF4455 domain-containing protein n=1 Tax=Anolis carolinensis TaxID=28377 RepID=H9GKT7_ANOCA